jgi:hypothetical protein
MAIMSDMQELINYARNQVCVTTLLNRDVVVDFDRSPVIEVIEAMMAR